MSTGPADLVFTVSTGLVVFAFAWSGGAKLGRSSTILEAMTGLRVPRFLRQSWVAGLLPVWELLLAVSLAFTSNLLQSWAALFAAATISLFTFLLIGALRRGTNIDCGCFGPLSPSNRISARSVLRNIGLIVLALIVAVLAPGRESLWMEFLKNGESFAVEVALAWALIAVIVLSILLRSDRHRPVTPSHPLPISERAAEMGDPIPDVEVVSGQGISTSLGILGRGMPVLLIFLSAECGSCTPVADRVPDWQEQLAPIRIRVLTSSRPDQVREHLSAAVPYARYGSVAAKRSLGVRGGPAAIMLGGNQRPVVASPVAYGIHEIDGLVHSILAARGVTSDP